MHSIVERAARKVARNTKPLPRTLLILGFPLWVAIGLLGVICYALGS
jgi:hypothetical protein